MPYFACQRLTTRQPCDVTTALAHSPRAHIGVQQIPVTIDPTLAISRCSTSFATDFAEANKILRLQLINLQRGTRTPQISHPIAKFFVDVRHDTDFPNHHPKVILGQNFLHDFDCLPMGHTLLLHHRHGCR
jgi:hypothetical protein